MITVSANNNEYGSVSGGGLYLNNLTLLATAKVGYIFKNWTENGNAVSTSASYAFTAAADRTLVANFVAAPVSVSAIPVFNLKGQYTPAADAVTIQVTGVGSDKLTKIYVNGVLATELPLQAGTYVVVATNDSGTLKIETTVKVQ